MRRALHNFFLSLADKLDGCRVAAQDQLQDSFKRLSARNDRLHHELAATKPAPHNFDGIPGEWTDQDAAALAAFLKTDSGHALAKRFSAVAVHQALRGCNDERNTVYAAGTARGWDEAFQWFISISRVTGVQATKPKDDQAPDGEEQLVERYSP